MCLHLDLVHCKDMHGDGDRGNPAGLETNVAGFPWGWNKIALDSRENVALFDFYGAAAATKNYFQIVE